MDGADDLRRPPAQVGFENLAIVRAGFKHVPERTTLGIVHHKIEVRRRLERTQEVRGPLCARLARLQEYVALELRRALLHGASEMVASRSGSERTSCVLSANRFSVDLRT